MGKSKTPHCDAKQRRSVGLGDGVALDQMVTDTANGAHTDIQLATLTDRQFLPSSDSELVKRMKTRKRID